MLRANKVKPKSSITPNTCAAHGQGCPRGGREAEVMEQWCSECVLPRSPERIVVSFARGYRSASPCYEAAGARFAAERAVSEKRSAEGEDGKVGKDVGR
jgi:hypothetical protein